MLLNLLIAVIRFSKCLLLFGVVEIGPMARGEGYFKRLVRKDWPLFIWELELLFLSKSGIGAIKDNLLFIYEGVKTYD